MRDAPLVTYSVSDPSRRPPHPTTGPGLWGWPREWPLGDRSTQDGPRDGNNVTNYTWVCWDELSQTVQQDVADSVGTLPYPYRHRA